MQRGGRECNGGGAEGEGYKVYCGMEGWFEGRGEQEEDDWGQQ